MADGHRMAGAAAEAAGRLKNGGIVAAATDTLVGLLAATDQPAAIEALVALKERREGTALSLIAPTFAHAVAVLDLDGRALSMVLRYWPGPLTVVARPKVTLHPALLLDGKTALRVPAPCDARLVAGALDGCVTATSANFRGETPPRKTAALAEDFRERLVAVGGSVLPALEEASDVVPLASTIVDVTEWPPKLLRQGDITPTETQCSNNPGDSLKP